MNESELEPLEQRDYGIGYKGHYSPQSHSTVKIEGGGIAIAISLLAFGVALAACILLPQIQAARTEAEIAKAIKELAVKTQQSQDFAWAAERSSNINAEHLSEMRHALEARGIHLTLNDHK